MATTLEQVAGATGLTIENTGGGTMVAISAMGGRGHTVEVSTHGEIAGAVSVAVRHVDDDGLPVHEDESDDTREAADMVRLLARAYGITMGWTA